MHEREVYTVSTLLTSTRNVVIESDLQSLGRKRAYDKMAGVEPATARLNV